MGSLCFRFARFASAAELHLRCPVRTKCRRAVRAKIWLLDPEIAVVLSLLTGAEGFAVALQLRCTLRDVLVDLPVDARLLGPAAAHPLRQSFGVPVFMPCSPRSFREM